jgi:hypothetical protein
MVPATAGAAIDVPDLAPKYHLEEFLDTLVIVLDSREQFIPLWLLLMAEVT